MKDFDKKIAVTASILAALTIAIGAFGAHGLKKIVDAESLISFETGVRYQMYHTITLFVLAFAQAVPFKVKKQVSLLFLLGILLFSGSIYLLSIDDAFSFSASSIAFATPLGGMFFIAGWLRLAIGLFRSK